MKGFEIKMAPNGSYRVQAIGSSLCVCVLTGGKLDISDAKASDLHDLIRFLAIVADVLDAGDTDTEAFLRGLSESSDRIVCRYVCESLRAITPEGARNGVRG